MTVSTAIRHPTFHPLVVADVERLTDDAVAVTFEVPEELRDAYAFEAGQSLTLRRTVDGVEERRSYSICAPVGARPRVGVRQIPGGLFSSWLVNDVRPGDARPWLETEVEAIAARRPIVDQWRSHRSPCQERGGHHIELALLGADDMPSGDAHDP